MKNFILGLIIGVCLTATWFYLPEIFFGKIYTVKSIESHYPHGDKNSETTIIVFLKGDTGHTKEILCAFPPSIKLVGSNENGWAGLKKVRIKGPAEKYMFGTVSYYAEKVQ